MRLKTRNTVTLSGEDGPIRVSRIADSIPQVVAQSRRDAMYGHGWVHANDRQLQLLLTRILLQGRAAELLQAAPALISLDTYIRRMRFFPDPESELAKLKPETRELLAAYAKGVNAFLEETGRVFELKLMRVKSEPWEVCDTMLLCKAFTYLGLSYAQASMERLILQLIQHGLDEPRLRELYPYLTDFYDPELLKKVQLSEPLVPEAVKWLEIIPRFTASNNWAVSGARSESGHPILCGDPHLEVNRLPGVWHEVVLRWPDQQLMGAALPGIPGVLIGRSRHVAWSATYSFMDMFDFRIERCRDGRYYRKGEWIPFVHRREILKVKRPQKVGGRRATERVVDIYENENGVLEGDPRHAGCYLAGNWSGRYQAGASDLNGLMDLQLARNAEQAMACFRQFEVSSYNWAIADTSGNIAYQMSGRGFLRPAGVSGLVAHPGWDHRFDPLGFIPPEQLPAQFNPKDGIIVSANDDLNHLGRAKPINLPMASYRANHIRQMLQAAPLRSNANGIPQLDPSANRLTLSHMKAIQYNLHSLQAERFMPLIAPCLPDTGAGRRLREWDCVYNADSDLPTRFENIYLALLRILFGDHGIGREAVDYLIAETGVFNDYYGVFDEVFFREGSAWFAGTSRAEILRAAAAEGLAQPAPAWGLTHRIVYAHLLFGGKLPLWLGFDRGPFDLPGCRASILQGQVFRSGNRVTTFSPSVRFITDLGTGEFHMNAPGGISDRRFSRLYFNRHDAWMRGIYTVLNMSLGRPQ